MHSGLHNQFTRFLCFVLLLLTTTACKGITGEASFKPHGIPLKVSLNTNGEIHFSVETSVEVPTPLGALEVGVIVDPAEYFGVKNTLTIRYDSKDNFYDLHGDDFDLEFESGYYKQVNLRKSGTNLWLELVKGDFTSCQIPVHGTYNFSRSDVIMNFRPGLTLFYDQPGGGSYSNDQAGCEISPDCTQLRAFNKDSADPDAGGVTGSWIDAESGISTAKWDQFIVTCERNH